MAQKTIFILGLFLILNVLSHMAAAGEGGAGGLKIPDPMGYAYGFALAVPILIWFFWIMFGE